MNQNLNIDYFTRSEDKYTRTDATQKIPFFVSQNKPFQLEREYAQALQAAKTQKMFTKPFIRSFGEYVDSVSTMEIHSQDSNICISGSYDGFLKINNIQNGHTLYSQQIVQGEITGIISYGNHLIVSDSQGLLQLFYLSNNNTKLEKQQQLQFQGKINNIKVYKEIIAVLTLFDITILDINSLQTIQTSKTGGQCMEFVSKDIIVIGNDITISIFSITKNSISNQFQVYQHINSISINQQFQQQVFLSCSDGFVYSFDQRNPKKAMDRYGNLPYAITVSASDMTGRYLAAGDVRGNIQLFKINTLTGSETVQSTIQSVVNQKIEKERTKPYRYTIQPQEIYTNKRSGQINCILFSPNTQYVLAGSNEGNIRVWKSLTWKPVGKQHYKNIIENRKQLINKYKNVSEINQILRSRKLPKKIANERKRNLMHQQAEIRKGKQGNTLDVVRKDE